jgi:hypothetical protein
MTQESIVRVRKLYDTKKITVRVVQMLVEQTISKTSM